MRAVVSLSEETMQVVLSRMIDHAAARIALSSPGTPLHAFLFDPCVSVHEEGDEVTYTQIFPSPEEAREAFVEVGTSLCLVCAGVFGLSSLSLRRMGGEQEVDRVEVGRDDDIDVLLASLVSAMDASQEDLLVEMEC